MASKASAENALSQGGAGEQLREQLEHLEIDVSVGPQ
jgi:hypothetical protein